MIDIKVIKKPKNEGSTSALRTGGTAYGGMSVKEAAHAAKADIAELAREATHAKESDHTLEADHAKEADHATDADETKHALEADHAKEADNADQWDYRHFDDWLDQPVRKKDGVAFGSVTSDSIRSAGQFVDGLMGAGFQLWKGEDGRTYLTIDKLTVRQTMAVMELLIEKVRSVGGQICVSAANGKIKAVEEQNDHYLICFEQDNMFVQHDLMRCQTFTGKDMRSYWVEVADVTEDGIVVAKEEFEGVEPKEGDECVVMGNTANTDRQNLVLISATEDGQPRVDVMDGVRGKTFDNCLRARLGSLDGIRDDKFPADRQPKGNGLYADNAFLKGTFVLETGEDVKTRFEITEGKVQSAIDSVRNDFLSEKGYLNNPTFASGLEKWNSENETVFFLVGNKWVWANGAALSKKGDGASVVTDMGRKVVRIRNKYIRQKHENLRFVPTFPTNGDGKKEALPVYLSFFYRCAKAGTLKIGFENVDKAGFADFDSLAVSEQIAVTDGYVQYTCSGLWNGTGDFKLAFDGDIYLYMLVLSTDKIEALTYKYKTLFEQSERLVKIAALNFDKDGKVLEGSEIITTTKYNALISERFDEHGALKNTAGLITATDWETWLNSYAGDMEKKLDIEAFAGMFASAVEESTDIVKRAEVSAFVTKDENGKLESGVRISADQITLEGAVTMNEYFKVNADGSLDVKSARMKDAEVTGVIHANLLYSSTKVNAPNKYQIDPEAEPCNMFFWEFDAIEDSWDATEAPYSHWIYLPDATAYDGLELSFFWDRPVGKKLKYLYVSAINGQKIIFEANPYYLMKTSDGSVIDVRRFGGCSKSDTRIYCLWNTYTTLKATAGRSSGWNRRCCRRRTAPPIPPAHRAISSGASEPAGRRCTAP